MGNTHTHTHTHTHLSLPRQTHTHTHASLSLPRQTHTHTHTHIETQCLLSRLNTCVVFRRMLVTVDLIGSAAAVLLQPAKTAAPLSGRGCSPQQPPPLRVCVSE